MVYDTALALHRFSTITDLENPITYFDETGCMDSSMYKKHFPEDSQKASLNFMTYGRTPDPWFSEGQKKTAKAMLSTFK